MFSCKTTTGERLREVHPGRGLGSEQSLSYRKPGRERGFNSNSNLPSSFLLLLVVTIASLVVTSALLVVTKSY